MWREVNIVNETLTEIHNHMKTRDAGGGGGESSGA